ncbi:MAG: hypothetical protein NC930_07175, partial [Candidatus Omnitrophica bacterium]|nr:hypothetical protein [Candidatus Omnitrophota bacterium]
MTIPIPRRLLTEPDYQESAYRYLATWAYTMGVEYGTDFVAIGSEVENNLIDTARINQLLTDESALGNIRETFGELTHQPYNISNYGNAGNPVRVIGLDEISDKDLEFKDLVSASTPDRNYPGVYIGVDNGGGSVRFGLLVDGKYTRLPKELERISTMTEGHETGAEYVRRLADHFRTIGDWVQKNLQRKVDGVGIDIPGVADQAANRMVTLGQLTNNKGWNEEDIRAVGGMMPEITKALGLPPDRGVIRNDMDGILGGILAVVARLKPDFIVRTNGNFRFDWMGNGHGHQFAVFSKPMPAPTEGGHLFVDFAKPGEKIFDTESRTRISNLVDTARQHGLPAGDLDVKSIGEAAANPQHPRYEAAMQTFRMFAHYYAQNLVLGYLMTKLTGVGNGADVLFGGGIARGTTGRILRDLTVEELNNLGYGDKIRIELIAEEEILTVLDDLDDIGPMGSAHLIQGIVEEQEKARHTEIGQAGKRSEARRELEGREAFDQMTVLGKSWVESWIPEEGITMEDGTKVTRITNSQELPAAVRPYWNDHVALVILDNRKLDYKAYIGIHHLVPFTNTLAEPEPIEELSGAIGGIRNLGLDKWKTEEEAMIDALILSYPMTVKVAWVGFNVLPLGGSKTMIRYNPNASDSERKAVYASVGKVLEQFPLTTVGQDVNTSKEFLEWIGVYAPSRTVGSTKLPLGGEDASPQTALGIQAGMREAVKAVFGEEAVLANRLISIQGIGNVGKSLMDHLVKGDKARVVVCDTNEKMLDAIRREYGGRVHNISNVATFDFDKVKSGQIAIISNPEDIYDVPAEIFSPNALTWVLNEKTIPRLAKAGVKIVAGAANEQLATPEDARRLADAGITYAVDYVINGGGVSGIFTKLFGVNMEQVIRQIGESTGFIIREARRQGLLTTEIAEREAMRRLYEFDRAVLRKARAIVEARSKRAEVRTEPSDEILSAIGASYPDLADLIAQYHAASGVELRADEVLSQLQTGRLTPDVQDFIEYVYPRSETRTPAEAALEREWPTASVTDFRKFLEAIQALRPKITGWNPELTEEQREKASYHFRDLEAGKDRLTFTHIYNSAASRTTNILEIEMTPGKGDQIAEITVTFKWRYDYRAGEPRVQIRTVQLSFTQNKMDLYYTPVYGPRELTLGESIKVKEWPLEAIRFDLVNMGFRFKLADIPSRLYYPYYRDQRFLLDRHRVIPPQFPLRGQGSTEIEKRSETRMNELNEMAERLKASYLPLRERLSNIQFALTRAAMHTPFPAISDAMRQEAMEAAVEEARTIQKLVGDFSKNPLLGDFVDRVIQFRRSEVRTQAAKQTRANFFANFQRQVASLPRLARSEARVEVPGEFRQIVQSTPNPVEAIKALAQSSETQRLEIAAKQIAPQPHRGDVYFLAKPLDQAEPQKSRVVVYSNLQEGEKGVKVLILTSLFPEGGQESGKDYAMTASDFLERIKQGGVIKITPKITTPQIPMTAVEALPTQALQRPAELANILRKLPSTVVDQEEKTVANVVKQEGIAEFSRGASKTFAVTYELAIAGKVRAIAEAHGLWKKFLVKDFTIGSQNYTPLAVTQNFERGTVVTVTYQARPTRAELRGTMQRVASIAQRADAAIAVSGISRAQLRRQKRLDWRTAQEILR